MQNQIKIEHYPIDIKERIKSLFFQYLGLIAMFGLISAISSTKNFFGFMIIISMLYGIFALYKMYQHRHFLVDFESDSNYVRILYLDFKDEKIIETTLDSIKIELINTSSKGNFNCQIKLKAGNVKFTIENEFQWDFEEMKQIFEFVQYHKNIRLSEKDHLIISGIEKYLNKNAF